LDFENQTTITSSFFLSFFPLWEWWLYQHQNQFFDFLRITFMRLKNYLDNQGKFGAMLLGSWYFLAQLQTQPTKLMAPPSQARSGKGLTGLSLAHTSGCVWTQNLFRAHGVPDRAYTIDHEPSPWGPILDFQRNFLVQSCNTTSRLVTLCKSCHQKEKNDNDWPKRCE
jgi:hypothetical protein